MDNQIPDVVELHKYEEMRRTVYDYTPLVLNSKNDLEFCWVHAFRLSEEERSIAKKRLTEDTDDKLFNGAAGKKRILSRGKLENPGLLDTKFKTLDFYREEEMLMLHGNAGDHHGNFRIRWSPLRYLGECPQSHHLPALIGSNTSSKQMNATGNSFSLDNNESGVVIDVVSLQQPFGCSEEMTSQLQHNSTNCNQNKHKETKPRTKVIQFEDPFNQHNKRKEKAQRVSSVVVLTMTFLGILFNVWSQLSIMKVQPLHMEHGSVSILSSLLGLLGFMVFVWGVAIMILVGAPFTRLHRAMLIFWTIMMHLRSANSIIAVYVPLPILGIFFMVWFACGKV